MSLARFGHGDLLTKDNNGMDLGWDGFILTPLYLFFKNFKSILFKKLNGMGWVDENEKILKTVLFIFNFNF